MIALGIAFGALLALVIIWLGYPLAIRAIGGVRRRGVPDVQAPRAVSVVLASCDPAEGIRGRVADLLSSHQPSDLLEVIVALDSANAQATPEDLSGLDPRVHVVTGDLPGGKAATLNLAERYWRLERWLRKWEARVHSCVGVTGAIYAMRRELWKPLPANLILDDVYLPMRLVLEGWRVGFTAEARAHDVRRFEAAQEYRRKVRTLTGVIQVCAWLPGVLNPIRNPLWLQFVFHKLLRLLTPYLAAIAILGMAWAAVSALLSSRLGTEILLAAAVAGAVLCLIPGVRRALKGQLAWGVAMQSSIVVATVNGVRGRWDVWR